MVARLSSLSSAVSKVKTQLINAVKGEGKAQACKTAQSNSVSFTITP
jgi:hypothetical protein